MSDTPTSEIELAPETDHEAEFPADTLEVASDAAADPLSDIQHEMQAGIHTGLQNEIQQEGQQEGQAEVEPEPPVDPKTDPVGEAEIEAKVDSKAIEAEAPVELAATPAVQEVAPAPVVAKIEPQAKPEPARATEPTVPAEPEESFADIFSEFQRTSSRRDGSSQIRGTVIAITEDSVLVDIGYKSEGILPLLAFAANREPAKVGDTLQVSVKGRDEDGYYQLSLFRTAVPKDWSSLERAFEEKSTIVGTVSAVVKGGLHVDVGVKAFLPASRSGARDAAEMEKLVGEEIRVRITKLDVTDEDVVVDRRIVTEEEALDTKNRRYAEVREGAVVDGTVRTIMEYGAFVDMGGVDGLLHISDIAWSRVANVADVLTVGQQIEVKVLKIDPETRRIALGLKQLQAHPWDAVQEKYTAGERVRGVVTRIAEFGAFVELEPGVEGLVHISEMSWSKRIHKATEVVNVGDVVDASILAIAIPERRISLGLKQALGDPWVAAAAKLGAGSVVEGPVASITKFGAFIQVAEGVEGMVHISEIVVDRRLNHPSDVLRVGQVVKALVLELDKEKRQLKLSIKQLIPTSMDEFLSEHAAGDRVTGRIVSIENGTARVELGEGIFCTSKLPAERPVEAPLAPAEPAPAKIDLSAFSSMLKSKWKTGSASDAAKAKTTTGGIESPQPGQVRSFRIATIDPGSKTIELELAQ